MDESKPKSWKNMNIICEVCGKNYTSELNFDEFYHKNKQFFTLF